MQPTGTGAAHNLMGAWQEDDVARCVAADDACCSTQAFLICPFLLGHRSSLLTPRLLLSLLLKLNTLLLLLLLA